MANDTSSTTQKLRPPRPRRRRRWLKWLTILVFLAGALGVAFYFLMPVVVTHLVRDQLDELAARMDRRMSFERFEIEKYHRFSIHGFAMSDEGPHQEDTFFRAERIDVVLDRTRLFAREPVLRELTVVNPELVLRDRADGTSNYLALAEDVRELTRPRRRAAGSGAGTGEGTGMRRAGRRLPGVLALGTPRVRVRGGSVDLSQVARPGLPSAVRDLELSVDSDGEGLALRFEFGAAIQGLDVDALRVPPERIELSGRVHPDDEVAEVMLGFGGPFELAGSGGLEDVVITLAGVGFEYPYTFRARGIEILDGRTRATAVSIPELTVAVRQLTLDPEDIHLSLVEARGMRVYAEVDQDGRNNLARLLGLPPTWPFEPPPEEAGAGEGDGSGEGEGEGAVEGEGGEPAGDQPATATAAGTAQAAPAAGADDEDAGFNPCRRRRWHECAPQTIDLSDLAVELIVHEDGRQVRTLDFIVPELRASQRLLNFQMDVATRAQVVERGVGTIGAGGLELVYYWMNNRWRASFDLDRFDLGHFVRLLGEDAPHLLESGVVAGQLEVADERPAGGPVRVEGDLGVTQLDLRGDEDVPYLVEDFDVLYQFAAALSEEGDLTMERGNITVEDVDAGLLFAIDDLDGEAALDYLRGFASAPHDRAYWEAREGMAPPWSRVAIDVDLQPQPANAVLAAVPTGLRHRLAGAEMEGHVGWRLRAHADFERDGNGRLRVDVPDPDEADLLDEFRSDSPFEDLTLVSLPEAIDVRRLNGDFSFTFSDGIGERRQLRVGGGPRWTPLAEITPYMEMSITNTEDQSFRRNGGFNWMQMRRVIGQVLARQELGRGASTISMQLVKNVFLSRERALARKFAEIFLTYWMTRLVSKERIMEVYLNVIEFGPAINGINEAAEHYFGKLPLDLTLAECTFLVSIVPSPRRYHAFYELGEITDAWWTHMQRYLDRLLAREQITEEEYEEALRSRPEFYLPADGDPPLRPADIPIPPIDLAPVFEDEAAPGDAQRQIRDMMRQ